MSVSLQSTLDNSDKTQDVGLSSTSPAGTIETDLEADVLKTDPLASGGPTHTVTSTGSTGSKSGPKETNPLTAGFQKAMVDASVQGNPGSEDIYADLDDGSVFGAVTPEAPHEDNTVFDPGKHTAGLGPKPPPPKPPPPKPPPPDNEMFDPGKHLKGLGPRPVAKAPPDNEMFDPKKHAVGLGPKPAGPAPGDDEMFDPKKHTAGLGPKPVATENTMFDPKAHAGALIPEAPKPEHVVVGQHHGTGLIEKLKREREELRAQDTRDVEHQARLEKQVADLRRELESNPISKTPLTPEALIARRQQKFKVEGALARVKARIAKNRERQGVLNEDLATLTHPGSLPSQRTAVLKRHSADTELEAEVKTDPAVSGLAGAEEASTYGNGRHATYTKSEKKASRKRKLGEVLGMGPGNTTTETVEVEDGQGKGKRTRDVKRGFLNEETVNSGRHESTRDGRTHVVERKHTDRRKLGEREDITEESHQIGDEKKTTTRGKKTTFDQGMLGRERTTRVENMEVDGDGKPTRGWSREHTNTAKVGIQKGEAKAEADHKSEVGGKHGKHLSTRAFGGAGFSVGLKIEKKDGKYFVVTTVTVRGNAGVGADLEKGSSTKGTVGATGELSGSATMSSRRVLKPAEYETYLGSLEAASSGHSNGGSRELAVIYAAATNGPQEAYNMIKGVRAQLGNADEAKALQDGEAIQLDTNLKGEAKGAVGGESGKSKVGLSGKAGASRDRQVLVERRDGKVIVTIMMKDAATVGAGASVGMGHVAGSQAEERTRGAVRTVRIALDPNQPGFDKKYEALVGASDAQALNTATHDLSADEVTLDSDGTVDGGKSTTGISVGPVGLDITRGHNYTDNYVLEDGVVKRKVEGSNSGGAEAHVNLGKTGPAGWLVKQALGDDKLKIGAKTEDKLSVTVGPDGDVAGDLTRERESYDSFSGKKKENLDGLHVRNNQWKRLSHLAKNPKAWALANGGSTMNRAVWLELGRKVRAAKGDPEKIAVAAAQYMDNGNHKSKGILQNALRERGTVNDTIRFELPAQVQNLKSRLNKYVFGSGASGDPNEVLQALETLRQDVMAHADDFNNPAAYADLMAGIRTQKAKARERLRAKRKAEGRDGSGSLWDDMPSTRPRRARPPSLTDYDPSRALLEPVGAGILSNYKSPEQYFEEAAEDQEVEEGDWYDLQAVLSGYKKAEDNGFGQLKRLVVDQRHPSIGDLERKGQLISKLREVHKRWKRDLQAAIDEGNRLDKDVSTLPQPNEELLAVYSDRNSHSATVPAHLVNQAANSPRPKIIPRPLSAVQAEEQRQRQEQARQLAQARSTLNAARQAATSANEKATNKGNTVKNNYLSKGSYPQAARLLEQGRKIWNKANSGYGSAGSMSEGTIDQINGKAGAYNALVTQYNQAHAIFSQALQAAQAGQ